MPKNYMAATIDRVNLFGTPIIFTPPGIVDYDGRQLFVHSTSDGKTFLKIVVDTFGPSSFAAATAAALPVTFDLDFLGTHASPAPIPAAPSTGGPLMITATVKPSLAPYGTDAAGTATIVSLDVQKEISPNLRGYGVAFIVIQLDDGHTYELRWIQNPTHISNAPPTANVVHRNPNTGGVSGPFGLDTP